jgi:hypothetical protein
MPMGYARHSLNCCLLAVGLLLPGQASAFDLSGAWASERDLCDHVFTKKGGSIGFAELSDLYGSGFIVNGNDIRGKAAHCTIKSRTQEGDTTYISATCASSIMTSDFKFGYKVVNDNTLTRLFPEIRDMTLTYSRCPL